MGKKVKKFIQGKIYEIGRRESWLRDMAKQGLILKKMGTASATFETGEPVDTEYRIKMTYQTSNQFEEYGWEKVNVIDDQVVYRCKDISSFTELPIYESEYEPAFKRAKRNELFSLLSSVICILVPIYSLLFRMHYMIDYKFTFMLMSIIFALIIFTPIQSCKEFKRIRAVKQERIINHHKNWRVTEKNRRLWILLGVVAISAILTFSMHSPEKVYALDDECLNDAPIEVLRLYELDDTVSRVNNNEDNYVSFSSNIFKSAGYKLEEGSIYSSHKPYLSVDYYELRAKFLSKLLQLGYTRYWSDYPDNTYEINSIYFDYVKVSEASSRKEFFIIYDNIVIYIEYSGDKTVEQLIEEVERKYADDWQAGKKQV